jgi:peptidoglycan/LPS O-acetylase OafA/YrhL
VTATGTQATTRTRNAARRFDHIDALRAVAVMLVVVSHAGLGHVVPGGAGVTIFFAISGFIITHLLLRERAKTGGFHARSFYQRRFLKIAPPFVVLIVLPTTVYALQQPINVLHVAAQLFFTYNWLSALGHEPQVLPGSGVVWSLAIEEQFYIVFALFWAVAATRPNYLRLLTVVSVSVLVLSNAVRLWFVLTLGAVAAEERIYYGSDTRAEGIALGVLAAIAYSMWQQEPWRLARLRWLVSGPWTLPAAVLLCLAALLIRDAWFRDTLRYTLFSLATVAVILYGFVGRDDPVRRCFDRLAGWQPVRMIGLASYSIYLGHYVLQSFYGELIEDWPTVGVLVTEVTISVVSGLVVYRVVEVPFERVRAQLRA